MISAIVLAHNTEATLPQTLEGLSFCDEVLVLDDYSTDKTAMIAKKYKARLFKRHLEEDFAAQRNFGLSQVRGDWILFVDSDEVVSLELAREIKQAIGDESKISGYYLKRQDLFAGRWLKYGETSRVKLLRLGRKGAGSWVRPVHETWQIKGEIGELKNPLQHFPHPNVAQFLDEINYYSTLNARYLYSQKVKVSWWQIVAYPKAKFFLNYFWHLGFLDGTAGIVVALMMSFHSFLTRAKLWQLWHKR